MDGGRLLKKAQRWAPSRSKAWQPALCSASTGPGTAQTGRPRSAARRAVTRAPLRAGASTIMINSASINGMPGHGSKQLLTDVLRGELGLSVPGDVSVVGYDDVPPALEEVPFHAAAAAAAAGWIAGEQRPAGLEQAFRFDQVGHWVD